MGRMAEKYSSQTEKLLFSENYSAWGSHHIIKMKVKQADFIAMSVKQTDIEALMKKHCLTALMETLDHLTGHLKLPSMLAQDVHSPPHQCVTLAR